MRLFIAEKPSLAKAIFEGLGGSPTAKMQNGCFTVGDDKITSCYGHMLVLWEPHQYDEKYKVWRLEDLPIKSTFPPQYEPKEESRQRFDIILKLIGEADEIVNACDSDSEGQKICDDILTYVNNTKPVKRILISDLNLKPVQKALNNLLPNKDFENLGLSALARSIGDQLFGYNLTRTYTLQGRKQGFSGILHVGRVQTAVLNLINSRTLVNQNHQESFYYDLVGKFSLNNSEFTAKYQPTDQDVVDEKNRIIDKNNSLDIKKSCNDESNIVTITTKPEKKASPLPYNLSSLQQICAKKWGYSAETTLEIIQGLYESLWLTYPRSDCRYLSEEHFDSKEYVLKALKITFPHLSEIIENSDISLKHKAFNTDKITAHHAICPTEKSSENTTFTEQEKNVYDLVVSSYIALFYPDSIRDKTRVVINNNEHEFIATQSVLVSQGWEVLFKGDIDVEQAIKGLDLSTLKAKQVVKCDDVDIEEKKTTPPKYFVESTLLAAMTRAAKFIEDPKLRKALELKDKDNSAESGSIGTEATRAGILNKLAENTNLVTIEAEKGYKEKVWKTTQQAQDFCKVLPPEIKAPDTSAIWSQQQALIVKGELSVEEFLSTLDVYLDKQVNYVKDNGISITPNMASCPNCKVGFIGQRKGANGIFWGCSNHPECKTAYPDKDGQPDLSAKQKRPPIISNHKCPECEKGLIRRKGKKKIKGKVSYFWGCSGYPECEITMFDKAGKPNFNSVRKPETTDNEE
jgi:DNA topoisomerase-3